MLPVAFHISLSKKIIIVGLKEIWIFLPLQFLNDVLWDSIKSCSRRSHDSTNIFPFLSSRIKFLFQSEIFL